MIAWIEKTLRIQIIHWPECWLMVIPSIGGAYPLRGRERGCIYRWRFRLFGVEIRKWGP